MISNIADALYDKESILFSFLGKFYPEILHLFFATYPHGVDDVDVRDLCWFVCIEWMHAILCMVSE